MTKYIASCSFGKDSIATILLAHENNEPLDLIIWSEVMFDENISGESPEHVDFIYNKAIPKLKELGYPVKVLRSKETYTSCFYHKLTRSRNNPERIGKHAGFPLSSMCVINRDCKVKPIKRFLKVVKKLTGENIVQYIGIAIDEPKRLARLTDDKVSLLAKYNYTEQMAYELCEKYDLLSPVYKTSSRGGCWFCPNGKPKEQVEFRKNYPNLWKKLAILSKTDNLVSTKFNRTKTFEELNEFLDKKEEEWNIQQNIS